MYKRLFTFGCSYTEYIWPTWADIIADDLEIHYENWGQSGAGNVNIACRLLECDLKNTFCDTDLILINWSSFMREDRFIGKNWRCAGNIFNNPYYDNRFINKYWNAENDIIKNCTAIISSNRMFNINYQSHMIDYEEVSGLENIIYDFSNYKYYLNNLPKKNLFDNSKNTQFGHRIFDIHPDILTHLNHVYTIYEDLNIKIQTKTIERYTDMQNKIIINLDKKNNIKKVNKSFKYSKSFFRGFNI